MKDITHLVQSHIDSIAFEDGLVLVFTPHTTAGITITENADPDVKHDLLIGLKASFPNSDAYQHFEGNSDAHMKSSVFGVSEMVIVENQTLILGTWQGIYFCEFDGPRTRKIHIKTIKNEQSI
jgi:secondary thiamine-phosphate synthase enzyme